MADDALDTEPVTAFQHNPAAVTARLKRSGRPLALTINGKRAVVVQDAVAYDRLRALAARAEADAMRTFLAESRADIDAGRTIPAIEFLESLGKKP